MNIIRQKAYAKINLGLDVLRRRPDGYHDVKMIMQSVDLFDKVTIKKTKTPGIVLHTNVSYIPNDQSNLVYRAANMMIEEFDIKSGVDIDLYKFIPVAAGMAGGSTDAAAVFDGMNKLFDLGLSTKDLMIRGVKLGADIPYCIMGGTALSEGIGDELTRLTDCPDCAFIVSKPPFGVSTKFVYENLVLDENTAHPDIDGIIESIDSGDVKGMALKLSNVLETVTAGNYPDIGKIEELMKANGAINAIMSGSGPTVFGVFEDVKTAEKCNEIIRDSKLTKTSYVVKPVKGGFGDA